MMHIVRKAAAVALDKAVTIIVVIALIVASLMGRRGERIRQEVKDAQARFNARDAVADSHAGGGDWRDRLRRHRKRDD